MNVMTCEHKWHVFSTAIEDVVLMCECDKCGSFGIVEDPSKEEWGEAFYAPSNPYLWTDNRRVRFIGGPR